MNAWHVKTDFVGLEYLTRITDGIYRNEPFPSYVAYDKDWVWIIAESLNPSGCVTVQYPIAWITNSNKCLDILFGTVFGQHETLRMVRDVMRDLSFLALHVSENPEKFNRSAREDFEPREQVWPDVDIHDETFQQQWRGAHV